MANPTHFRNLTSSLSLGLALTALAISFLLSVVAPQPAQAQTFQVIYTFTGNVPTAWTTNLNCSFTKKGTQVKGGKCIAANCPDAYQHPTDHKQVACPVNASRGYVVTYCPSGSSMPNP
jgi:hypothetical protein